MPPVVQPVKDFPAFYETQGVHYHIHKSPSLVPTLSQTNPVHTIPPRSILILSIHLHLHLPSLSGLLPSNFPTHNLFAILFSPIHATCFAHLILNLIILIILGWRKVQVTKLLVTQFPPPSSLHPPSVQIFY
jgi:hypothetical protein